MEGAGLVINTFAAFPRVIEPWVCNNSSAYAVLIVAALKTSSGVIFILMHANESMSCIFPVGALPGLKSLATASGNPSSIIFLAGGKGRLRKNAAPGRAVGIVALPFSNAI